MGADDIVDRGRFPLRLSTGTQVVTRVDVHDASGGLLTPSGTLGVIQESVDDRYVVRFSSGITASLERGELSIRRRAQETSLGPARDPAALLDELLGEHLIFRCIIGSRAYGLEREGSDEDRRGIFQAPAELLWSLQGAPDFLDRPEREEAYWELRKFVVLALKANPTALECLWSPLVEHVAGSGEQLLAMREAFLSKLAYQTYNGYVLSQFRKLEADLRTRGEPKWKHVMHLLRLLLSGISLLRERTVLVRVGEHRERLLAVRDGELPWSEVDAWRRELHRQLEVAFASSRLPDLPGYERADAFLVDARRRSVVGSER